MIIRKRKIRVMLMPQSYFVWNGIDCRSKGILLAGPAPIIRPEERVNHVQIPGRSGDLTETEGDAIYNSYIQTVTMHVHGGYRVREVYQWLRGSGYVTFSGEPDRRQRARIIGAITLNKHCRNLDWWSGEAQIYCQPLKELLYETEETVTNGATVRNNGDVDALPLITATASSTSITLTVTAGGSLKARGLTITGTTSGTTYLIDCESMEIWNAAHTAILTKNSSGEFPVLEIGNNTVTFTNCSSVKVLKRERYL